VRIKNNLIKILIVTIVVLSSCDKGFVELNTNPTASSTLEAKFLLPNILAGPTSDRFTEWRTNFIITASWSQQLVGGWAYDRYNSDNDQYTGAYMDRLMPTYMAEMIDLIEKNQGTAIGAMALTNKVHFMHRVADMHGMIPYSQAFKPGEFLTPKYDDLETIYNTMFDELRTAREWFEQGAGENPGEFDVIYNGDYEKWAKYANSLLLRLGLRLSEVDPAKSQSVITEALEAGVMTSNDDDAWVRYTGTSNQDGMNSSGRGLVFNDFGVSGHLFRYSDVFVDFISENNDPREGILIGTYDFVDNAEVLVSLEPGTHKGMRAGTFGEDGISTYEFAQPRRDIMVRYDSPTVLMSFGEVELNRAEAILRGWADGSAKDAYESGVKGAMRMLDIFPSPAELTDNEIITEEEIRNYLDQSSIQYSDSEAMRLINTQKWVALLFDGYESFANYRRIGYPFLEPVNSDLIDPLSDGDIPKRVIYPQSEVTTNTTNYLEAIEKQGPDDINTRLWWDVN